MAGLDPGLDPATTTLLRDRQESTAVTRERLDKLASPE
jgi:hypothetical protein